MSTFRINLWKLKWTKSLSQSINALEQGTDSPTASFHMCCSLVGSQAAHLTELNMKKCVAGRKRQICLRAIVGRYVGFYLHLKGNIRSWNTHSFQAAMMMIIRNRAGSSECDLSSVCSNVDLFSVFLVVGVAIWVLNRSKAEYPIILSNDHAVDFNKLIMS